MNNLLLKWKELNESRNKMNQKLVITKECFSLKISNDPTLLLITSRKQSSEEEFVVINTLGENVFASSDQPSEEMNLHLLLYQQLNIKCVLQIQTVHNTIIAELFSKSRELQLPQENKIIPILDNENEILQFISECSAVVIKDRGIVAWGNDLEVVQKLLQKIEFQCDYQIKKKLIETNQSVI